MMDKDKANAKSRKITVTFNHDEIALLKQAAGSFLLQKEAKVAFLSQCVMMCFPQVCFGEESLIKPIIEAPPSTPIFNSSSNLFQVVKTSSLRTPSRVIKSGEGQDFFVGDSFDVILPYIGVLSLPENSGVRIISLQADVCAISNFFSEKDFELKLSNGNMVQIQSGHCLIITTKAFDEKFLLAKYAPHYRDLKTSESAELKFYDCEFDTEFMPLRAESGRPGLNIAAIKKQQKARNEAWLDRISTTKEPKWNIIHLTKLH